MAQAAVVPDAEASVGTVLGRGMLKAEGKVGQECFAPLLHLGMLAAWVSPVRHLGIAPVAPGRAEAGTLLLSAADWQMRW